MTGDARVREAAVELSERVPSVGALELVSLLSGLAREAADTDPDRAFGGTPAKELSPVRLVPVEDRPSPQDLLHGLQAALLDREQDRRLPWLASYVGTLVNTSAGFGARLPSLDLHGLSMVVLGSTGLADSPTSEWEAAAFAWLHEVVHDEQPAEDWVCEAVRRRELRLAHTHLDAAVAAACEGPLPDDFLDRLAVVGTRLDVSQVEELWLGQTSIAPDSEDAMTVRIDSLARDERLDWAGGLDDAVAVGHMVGWLLRHDVAVDVPTLLAAPGYAAGAVRHRNLGPVRAHREAMREISDWLELPVPLGTQLAFLAWVLDQAQSAVHLTDVLPTERPHGRVRLGRPQARRDDSPGVRL